MLTILTFTFIYYISLTDKFINPAVISRLLGLGLMWVLLNWINVYLVSPYYAFSFLNGRFSYSTNNFSFSITGFIILLTFIYMLLSGVNWGKGNLYPYVRDGITNRNNEFGLFVLLNLLSVIFIYLLNDYITFALSIEILSITSYLIACRFWSNDKASIVKNTLQYFIISSIGTFLILVGIVWVYLLTGTVKLEFVKMIMETWTSLSGISINDLVLAHIPILIGMCIKAGLSPFHSWSLTVYTQNYLSTTLWMYVFTKLSYLPVILTVLISINKGLESSPRVYFILLLGFANILIGSVSPFLERNLVRILIYSSLSHAGYMTWSMLYGETVLGSTSFMFYLISYTITSFSLIYLVYITKGIININGYPLALLDNLWNKDRWLRILWILNLLSLIGIPPMIGFYAKFYFLSMFIHYNRYGLAVLTIFGSVVSAYYYLTLILRLFENKEVVDITTDLELLHQVHKIIVTIFTIYSTLYMFIPVSLYEMIEIVLKWNCLCI